MGFKKVTTVELNYSDAPEGVMNRTQPARPAQLALYLRSQTRRDIDYWSITPGQPLQPGQIHEVIMDRLEAMRVIDSPRPVEAASRSEQCSG